MTDPDRISGAPTTVSIEVPSAEDWDEFIGVDTTAFASVAGPAELAAERTTFEPERALIARRDGTAVGTAGIYTRHIAVPGGVVPAGHVTFVAVVPTARRQGILTRFMHRQFADMRAAGEPLAVLWASEGRIYQRFGYGLAAARLALTAQTRELTLPGAAAAGAIRQAEPEALREAMGQVFARVYPGRPGWSSRGELEWDRTLVDPEEGRNGATPRRAIIHAGADGPDGYALWRVLGRWNDTGPDGVVQIKEIVAATAQAYQALWRFLLDIDLTRTAEWSAAALDEPLLTLASDPARLGARLSDALWLRILDLPAALAARRYATDLDVVLEVTDAVIPANAGRWRLQGSPAAATCVPTAQEPDLRCDIRTLAIAYLGGTTLATLAAGGQLDEVRPGALVEASTAFGWHRAPSVVESF